MKHSILSALVLVPLCCAQLLSQVHRSGAAAAMLNDVRAAQAPTFIENRGQWDARARFLLQGNGYDCWVGTTGILYDIYDVVRQSDGDHRRGVAVGMEFVGANTSTITTGATPREGYRNYLIGNDQSRWATNVREYEGVSISNLYDGVDVKLSVEAGQPRYDLIVAAAADPSKIAMRYTGGSEMHVNASGDLVIATAYGQIEHRHPIAYQTVGSRRVPVEAWFTQENNGTVGFRVGAYDRSQPLVIDPVISSRVFAGGVRDGVYGVAVNNDGRAYLCGWSYSVGYPTTPGSYDSSINNDSLLADAVVMKVNTASMAIEYSTFIGGLGSDVATGIVLNPTSGEVVVCGETRSTDFPTSVTGMQRVHAGGSDIFVLRLGATGNTLSYGTFLGGTRDEKANEVVEDENGLIYLCGATTSANFPVSPTAVKPTYSSPVAPFYTDGFVAVINPSDNSYAATYLGGSGTDEATDLTLTRDRSAIVVVGGTWSANFPLSADALQPPRTGNTPANEDAFITVVSPTADALVFSSYLGGSQLDIANAVALGPNGSVLVCGETQSRNFPATRPYDSFQVKVQAPDIFVAELNFDQRDLNGRPSIVSSVTGGSESDVAYDIVAGQNGERWVVGVTASEDMPVTPDGYQLTHSDSASYDCFMMQFDSASHSMIYGTYLGGDDDDFAFGVAIDPQGDIYVAGATASSNYPVSTAPYTLNTPGKTGAFITRFAKVAGVATPPVRTVENASISAALRQSEGRVELTLNSTDGKPHTVSAELYDLQGRPVTPVAHVTAGTGAPVRVDCGVLTSGTYMMRMVVDREQVIARPVLVVR